MPDTTTGAGLTDKKKHELTELIPKNKDSRT